MTTLLLTALLLSGVPETFSLPALSDSCDFLIIMLEDGAIPQEPWAGISDYQREELWSFGCRGLMVERMGWSGYIILTPPGTAGEILETAEILAVPDSTSAVGEVARWMELEQLSDCGPVILHFSSEGSSSLPVELPVRSSGWLAGPSDTLMIQSTNTRSTFCWTEFPDSVSLAHSAWRGTGTEVVPVGNASVRVAFSTALGSVPSSLHAVSTDSHPLDANFMGAWGAAFGAVDSLIALMYPVIEDTGHLLWLRGEASEGEMPFFVSPAPQPPASVLFEMTIPDGWTGVPIPGPGDASRVPGVVMVTLPGQLSDPDRGDLMATILERIIARSVIPELGLDVYFDVEHDDSGKMILWLVGSNGNPLPEGATMNILDILREVSLIPPGVRFLNNAAVRTALMTGNPVASPAPNVVAGELLRLTGTTGSN